MRCLVRDPRRLGAQRVRVQIALGDLSRPAVVPQRDARRGHRRAPRRLDPRPAPRLDRGARRDRDVADGAGRRARRRRALPVLLARWAPPRTAARASSAPRRSPSRPCARPSCRRSSSRPSIVYAPGDRWLTTARTARAAARDAGFRPRARALPADLGRGRRRLPAAAPCATGSAPTSSSPARRRSATPRSCASCCARSAAAARSCTCRRPSSRGFCGCSRAPPARRRFATWDEAELMEVSMSTSRGTADAERLGVRPQPMGAVLAPAM